MVTVRQEERPYTADDLNIMPDDGQRYEILGGELIVSPAPSTRHQDAVRILVQLMSEFLQEGDRGRAFVAPIDVHLSEHDILQPDIVVVLREHRHQVREDGLWGPPDLVVEVVSPRSVRTDRIRKAAAYAAFGVPEYWLVDPEEQSILVQKLEGGRYHPVAGNEGLARSVVLDGLIIDPREVFALSEWLMEG